MYGLKRIFDVIDRRGDARHVNDVVNRPVYAKRLANIAFEKCKVWVSDITQGIPSRAGHVIIKREDSAGFSEESLVKIREYREKVASQKTRAAGDEHGFPFKRANSISERPYYGLDVFFYDGRHCVQSTVPSFQIMMRGVGTGIMNLPPFFLNASFFFIIGSAKFHARMSR